MQRRYKESVKKVEELSKEDRACQELLRYLRNFGETGTSLATVVVELRGKHFKKLKELIAYAMKNKRLCGATNALTEMVWRNRNRSEKARLIVEELGIRQKRRCGSGF